MEATDIYGYLRAQAGELGARILESFPPLQSTTDDVPAELSTLLRRPLPAQGIAIGGLAKHFRSSRAARIVAECGAAKPIWLWVSHTCSKHAQFWYGNVPFAPWEEMGAGGDPDHSVCTYDFD
jgi:hypothetical protein